MLPWLWLRSAGTTGLTGHGIMGSRERFPSSHMISTLEYRGEKELGYSSDAETGNRTIRCLEREREALVEFKNQLVDEYGRLSSWSINDCCKWRGVRCNGQTNHVTELDLRGPYANFYWPSAPLKGTISHSLLQLQYLNYLDLSYNDFNSSFPGFIGSLSELQYLNLSYAHFRGSIPHQFGNLSNLQVLDLRQIQYCYSDDLDWLSRLHLLEYLDLSSVSISKANNWIEAISSLVSIKEIYLRDTYPPAVRPSSLPLINASTHLAVLDLSRNAFTRNDLFPSMFNWFLNFSSSLTNVDLSVNELGGPIPDVFGEMMFLSNLDLSYCDLEGGIPEYFRNMSSLMYLNLFSNRINGQLVELMMNLPEPVQDNKLQYLDLSLNLITGPIPNMSRFPLLAELRLGKNQLNGSVAEGYLRLPFLILLDLSSNMLTGLVPHLSFSLALKQLYLNDNFFNGTLTKSIGNLSELEILCLGSNQLQGTISEAMLSLPRLRILDLPSNSFLIKFSPLWIPPFRLKYLSLAQCDIGPYFPEWLRTQNELVYLDVSSANIIDTIPAWFGNLSLKLIHLNASNNQIRGAFPKVSFSTFNIGTDFSGALSEDALRLDISRNQLSGSVDFLCHVRFWRLFDISDNMFSGQLPDCFAKFDRLEYMNLANNHLSGKIPYSFGSLSALSLLQLRNNSFSGEIPTSMRNCTRLGMIDLGQNKLSGTIPSWIGDNISNLVVLSLSSNQFHGGIPPNLCRQTDIQILDLSTNKISGEIPKCLHNLSIMTVKWIRPTPLLFVYNPGWDLASLTDGIYPRRDAVVTASLMWKGREVKYANNLGLVKLIDFSSNEIVGGIPSELTELLGLVGLNLSRNKIVGIIPPDIGRLERLNFLDLSRNMIGGGIPMSLSKLGHLGVLDLSYNNLSGRIPFTTLMLTFNEAAFTGNAGLCGQPLLKSCPGDKTSDGEDDDDGVHAENEDDDKFIGRWFYVAMVLGFPVGFWGILWKVLLNERSRHGIFQGG
ncbi:hypothetical protein C2S52_012976 [Perilla frutescens var. hirtella]|nr:hypothetical protein C2S52_012976 [Perilla frutescens var. hirtella]